MDSGVAALDDLLTRYDDVIAADGGNGVRRVLGKLGPTSPLHRVDKAANLVARDLEDERAVDLVTDFLRQIDDADGLAYSSIFVPTGGAARSNRSAAWPNRAAAWPNGAAAWPNRAAA